jgi:hypothetical protein
MNQRTLRLNVRFDPAAGHAHRADATPERNQQRLAAHLRSQAAAVADDVQNCPTESLPHHLTRLRDLRETMRLLLECAGFLTDAQRMRTDRQLLHPSTVADWAAALEIVHRTLAALVVGRPGAAAAWDSLAEEDFQ